MRNCVFAIAAVLALACSPANANDTELTYGGTPRPLTGNTTVSMKSEVVKIVVGDEYVTVDCLFKFFNHGPERKVRMGFPDEGGEPDEDVHGNPLPVTGTFETFASWVNGRRVRTTVIRGADRGDRWHAKYVTFPARRTLTVRDRYVVKVGGSVAFSPISVSLAKYVLHTGSSWRGNLGRSEVEVVFRRKSIGTPIIANRVRELGGPILAKDAQLSNRSVYYIGPGKPRVSGRTLRFVRTNWRPTKADDIFLAFNAKRLKIAQ